MRNPPAQLGVVEPSEIDAICVAPMLIASRMAGGAR